ncbi:hypothetical protein [Paracidobacterium acidisoli]|uniref:Outer membrane protein beta-barrel domain-containing protein n=1 Tax=Paracidobacterium acidisoli TaxID=2303751 RepID=A0A372IPJ8_9BACT|nr:hypothetical protein [Paracidobacterium acidisoli]MBT9331198.1 hypothetical protein [Paracidobacterium acidisoli]
MFSTCSISHRLWRHVIVAAGVAALTSFAVSAMAQTQADAGNSSSSTDYRTYISTDALLGSSALPAAPAAGANASPQYGGQRNYPRYPQYQNRWSHLAFDAGGGFTIPIGNTAHGNETWGYNIGFGGGWNFTKRIGVLLQYRFNKDKIPGSTLTALYNQAQSEGAGLSGPLGGNVNTWSLTLEPIFYQPFTKKSGAYVTGGGGFYRKVTNFTELQEEEQCYYYCYVGYAPSTVAHSSSNQGGLNIGAGFYWKAFGEDSNAKFFTEARYVWVDSPVASNSDPFGSGTQSLIPVTFGLRF